MNPFNNDNLNDYAFISNLCDSKEWRKRHFLSMIGYWVGFVFVMLNVSSRSVGTESKSILDYLGVPIGFGLVILFVGILVLIASFMIGYYDYRKGKIIISKDGANIKGEQFSWSGIKAFHLSLNENDGKPIYGKRSYRTGGRNFIKFINENRIHNHEFYISTNTEELKLRSALKFWVS
ncbi:hypothetical protein [Roseivirga thermotolerans]|uniref:hypothetical protein n=1 Tax=Roseivirga thermotolerans TaxID=1758176 RepID=UPI00274004D1|nr:hypothetical protein [Roseivirga thermotolerans]